MKTILYTFAFYLFFLAGSMAQVSLTNSYFPKVGDQAITQSAFLNAQVAVPAAGTNQVWDLTKWDFFISPSPDTILFEDPSVGSTNAFPDANLLVRNEFSEQYLKKTSTTVEAIGLYGDLLDFGFNQATRFAKPYIERHAPFNYGEEKKHQSLLQFKLGVEAIPGVDSTILAQFDSVRIGNVQDITRKADAWGKMTIPGNKTYDVLRIKEDLISSAKIELKLKGLPIWLDVTNQFPGGGFSDTSRTYQFYSPGVIEPIAIFYTDSSFTMVTDLDLKYEKVANGIQEPAYFSQVQLFPNPASDECHLRIQNEIGGAYRIEVQAMTGQRVWSQQTQLTTGENLLDIPVGQFPSGHYFLSIQSNDGSRLLYSEQLIRH